MKDNRLYFHSIHIIESLRVNDYHTGRRLFEDVEPMGIVAEPAVSTQFTMIQTRAEFLDLLRSIREHARQTGHSPILHIEAHGSQNGIQVTSGECLTWLEFKAELTAINEASKLNLLVLLAACDGANLLSIIQPMDRAPVFALIGPNRAVTAGEIERGALAFYKTLLERRSAAEAWRAMNRAVSPGKTTFSVFTAEYTLRYIIHHYLKSLCSEEVLATREDRAVAQMAQQKGLNGERLERFRQWFRLYVRDHQRHFEGIRNYFFFCDLYPENATRFNLSFEDCVREPSAA